MIFYIVLLLISCQDPYCENIRDVIEQDCYKSKEPCLVTFSEAFPFYWDTLYVIESEITPNRISKKLGIRYNGPMAYDGSDLIIFRKGDRIIRSFDSRCDQLEYRKFKSSSFKAIARNQKVMVKYDSLDYTERYLVFPE